MFSGYGLSVLKDKLTNKENGKDEEEEIEEEEEDLPEVATTRKDSRSKTQARKI